MPLTAERGETDNTQCCPQGADSLLLHQNPACISPSGMPTAPPMAETQANQLQAELPHASAPSGQEPQVIIPSVLTLTLEQEQRLLRHCARRFQELGSELGRADYENPTNGTSPMTTLQRNCMSHFGKRHLSHLIYQQRMEWRAHILGGIYAETNIHLPITTRIVGQQIARANKTFFGTSPYFAIAGLSADSDLLAADVDAYAHHQLDTLGGIGASLENAVELAFIQGETVVKTRRHKLTSYFESMREVLVDEAGEPYVAQDGDYIYKTDIFVTSRVPVVDPTSQQPVLDETGQPVMQDGPDLVLKRDMATPQPAVMNFVSMKLDLTKVLEDKIEAQPIYYLDFLCPLSAANVQVADIAIHCYNSQVIEMADRFLRDQWGGMSPSEQIDRVSRLVNAIQSGSNDAKQALGDRDRPEQGQINHLSTGRDRTEPVVGLAECWLWFDVFGDGVMRSIMVLMDQDGKIPIYYDYTANLTDDGLRPLDVVRINPVTGRWHGQGNVERFYSLQDQADLLINRAFFAESRGARVDFWNPAATVEGRSNPNLELNWGGTYRLEDGKTAADALSPVYLTNIKNDNLKNLLETVLQTMQAMSAVSNVNDGAMAGLDTAKLATGIRNLEASGEELFHQYVSQLRPCLEGILRRALKTLLKNVAESDTEKGKLTKFFDRGSQRMVEIDPMRLTDLDLQIALTLTTYDRQSRVQSTSLAYTMLMQYLLAVQAPIKVIEERAGKLVAENLSALQVKNAADLTAPVPPELRQMLMPPAGTPGVGAPNGPPVQPAI